MDIIITANKTLADISNEFNRKFPYLRLEFYAHTHEPGKGTPAGDRLDSSLTIAEAGNFDHAEELSINGHLKASTLESRIQDLYGIGVQVLRRSGSLWLQSTVTDGWTLTKQNEEGKKDSMPIEYVSD